MLRTLVVSLLLALPSPALAWEAPLESAVALEIGGEGLLASVHYENLVIEHQGGIGCSRASASATSPST